VGNGSMLTRWRAAEHQDCLGGGSARIAGIALRVCAARAAPHCCYTLCTWPLTLCTFRTTTPARDVLTVAHLCAIAVA